GRHLRRAWRRSGYGQVLPQDWVELRELQSIPGADRAAGGRPGGAGEVNCLAACGLASVAKPQAASLDQGGPMNLIPTPSLFTPIVYPDSDGLPMSDNTKQFRW